MSLWQANDVAIAAVIHDKTAVPGLPAGWTGIGNGAGSSGGGGNSIGVRTAFRVLDGSETNAGFWTWNGSLPWWGGVIAIYRGVDTSDPIGLFNNAATAGGGVLVWSPVTPTDDSDNWVLAVGWHNSGTVLSTAPSGLTHRAHGNASDGIGLHDSNGGTTGWAGGVVDLSIGGLGARQSFELRSGGGAITFVEYFYSSGHAYTDPVALPATTVQPSVSQAIIVG